MYIRSIIYNPVTKKKEKKMKMRNLNDKLASVLNEIL